MTDHTTDDRKMVPAPCPTCGLPLSRNPHPDAGTAAHYLLVGCPKVCIPCLALNRHQWASRATKAEKEVSALKLAASLCGISSDAEVEALEAFHVYAAKRFAEVDLAHWVRDPSGTTNREVMEAWQAWRHLTALHRAVPRSSEAR